MRSDLSLLWLAVGLCGYAFAQAGGPELSGDFAPPHGGFRAGHFGEIQWEDRLLTATSTDGLTFTRTNIVVTDQARSPNLVVAADTLYLYFSTAAGNLHGSLAVAISSDQGKTWIFKHVEVKDGAQICHPFTPDVRLLTDGRFRLSFNENRSPSVYYANSPDGIHFTKAGTVMPGPARYGSLMTGSLTIRIGEVWHTYLRDANSDLFGLVSHGVSIDGEAFQFAAEPRIIAISYPNSSYPTSAVDLGAGLMRFYGSPSQASGGVLSFLTRDGVRFEPEPGVRLALDSTNGLEKNFVKDAAVVKLADGTYFMVYMAGIP
jgi:hypothetical protein